MIRLEVHTSRPRIARIAQVAFFGGAVAIFVSSTQPGPVYIVAVPLSALVSAAGGFTIARLSRSGIPALWSVYMLLIGVGSVVRSAVHPGRPILWAIAGTSIVTALFAMGLAVKYVRRSKELERLMSVEATSLAFFAT